MHEDQYSGEHYFYAQLRAHPWRVRQSAAALLFVVRRSAHATCAHACACTGTCTCTCTCTRCAYVQVPLYANAAMQPSAKGLACDGTHYQTLFDATARAVAATPQYARHLGADHVLVSNSWKTSQRPPMQAIQIQIQIH